MDQGSEGGPASLRGSVADLAVVDAHQHFWDPVANYHPWLRDEPPIPFRYGDYRAIRHRYLPPDYRADAAPIRIDRTVYVETEWDPTDPVGEMRYVERLRQEFGLPTVAVAHARLDEADAPKCLRSRRRSRSCAAFATSHGPIARRRNPSPGGMADARWRNGYAELGRNDLRFDLQTPWWHLGEATRLANDFPDTPMILNHTGLPADRCAEGVAGWKAAMKTLASVSERRGEDFGLGPAGPAVDGRREPRHRAHDNRSLRCAALHVREQLSGRQSLRKLPHDLRRLSRDRARLLGRRAARAFPRQRHSNLRDGRIAMAPVHIGYVGVGLMGLPMVRRLVSRGHDVVAYDIVDGQVQLATQIGARAASTASQAVRDAEFVLLNLPTTDAVEQAVFGPDGVAAAIMPPQTPHRFLDQRGGAGQGSRRALARANRLRLGRRAGLGRPSRLEHGHADGHGRRHAGRHRARNPVDG